MTAPQVGIPRTDAAAEAMLEEDPVSIAGQAAVGIFKNLRARGAPVLSAYIDTLNIWISIQSKQNNGQ